MSLWISVTLAAACFQTLRFVLQKSLASTALTAAGATFARFVYSAPLIGAGLAAYLWATDQPWPTLSPAFWGYGAIGGFTQVLATICVVMLFKSRNFAVGITFKKTETIQTILVGLVVLGEGVSLLGFCAIALGLVGVLLLSTPPDAEQMSWRGFVNRAAALGVASGGLFAISGVCYRAASLELAVEDPLARAGVTLACVVVMQMVGMALWLKWRQPFEIAAVWRARRTAVWIGVMSMAGSICWFVAFTLQTVAYVKALGQIELILSVLASTLFFRERIGPREWVGLGVLTASIITLILVI